MRLREQTGEESAGCIKAASESGPVLPVSFPVRGAAGCGWVPPYWGQGADFPIFSEKWRFSGFSRKMAKKPWDRG